MVCMNNNIYRITIIVNNIRGASEVIEDGHAFEKILCIGSTIILCAQLKNPKISMR